ncbi:MAG: response regulator transcription factor [bacterium]
MKIIIAEDQALLRKLLVQLCEKDLCFRVLADTSDGAEALELCRTLSPDILLLDIVMPSLDGLEVARQILPEKPRLRILGFSAQCNPRTVHQAIECGLHGLLDKSHESWTTLKEALSIVANGGAFFSETVKQMRQQIAQDPLAFSKILSKREQEMLTLFGRGMSNQTIADRTALSPKTVQGHRHNVMKKLDIRDTPHLMLYALETGFWRPHYQNHEKPSHNGLLPTPLSKTCSPSA